MNRTTTTNGTTHSAPAPVIDGSSPFLLGFAVFAAGEVTYIEGNTPQHAGLAAALADTEHGTVVPAY